MTPHGSHLLIAGVSHGATAPPAAIAAGPILYRYVSCGGGAAPPCGASGTIIPDAQQEEPYLALRECDGISASYQDQPACPHTACGGWDQCGGADAIAWLEDNGW